MTKKYEYNFHFNNRQVKQSSQSNKANTPNTQWP